MSRPINRAMNRPPGRPIPRRLRHKGPAALPPLQPSTNGDRKRMLSGALGELKRLTRRTFGELRRAGPAELWGWAEAIGDSDAGRQGRALRAVRKLIRLRGGGGEGRP